MVHSASNLTNANLIIYEQGSTDIKFKTQISVNSPQTVTVDSVELWSPESPTLYNISVVLGKDAVASYIGFRTISKGEVNGVLRPLLNGEFIFMFGTLDQGYVNSARQISTILTINLGIGLMVFTPRLVLKRWFMT